MRYWLADQFQRVADRLNPTAASRRIEAFDAIHDLGRFAYGGDGWTSLRTMIRSALEQAQRRDDWREIFR